MKIEMKTEDVKRFMQLEVILENHNIETLKQLDDLLSYVKQIKDIEDDFGVELSVLSKALKNGCWIRKGIYGTCFLDGEPIFIDSEHLHLSMERYYSERNSEKDYMSEQYIKESCLCLFDMEYEDVNNIARVQDYGKTWALTKEGLENE